MIVRRSHVVRYRGRRFNPRAPVLVYRNLNRKGRWYSVMQGGRVVGHTQFLVLHDVTFVVREAGRRKAVETKVRNVHAFVKGLISYIELFFRPNDLNPDGLVQVRHRAGYLPRLGYFWVQYKSGSLDPFGAPEYLHMRMTQAAMAVLSKDGLSVDEPTTLEIPGATLNDPLLLI